MCSSASEKIRAIAVSNLRHNFLPHLVLAVLLLFLTPLVFGTANLDMKAAAVPLEMFVSLTGIILLTPVFLPEQHENVRDVVESKATPPACVYSIRIGTALLGMAVLIAAFVVYLKGNGCAVGFPAAFWGTFSGGFFLGALGLLAYGMSGSITIGYMVPMIYYMFNLFGGQNYFGKLYLFSMASGGMNGKYWLLAAGGVLTAAALVCKNKRLGRSG